MAQTPWGEIAVSDAHVHFFSHRFFSLLAAQKQTTVAGMAPLLDWEMPPEDPAGLAGRWVAELDRNGVRRAALIASLPGDEASVEAAVRSAPERFFGYFMVNPADPQAPARVEAALAGGALRGLCFFPAMHGYSMHDDRAAALLEMAASRKGCAVFVHCGVLSVGVRKKLGLPSRFDLRFSNPIDVHALAMRYPDLPFVIPHFGAGYFREALMVADLCPNVYLDTSSSNGWMKYQMPPADLRQVFERALEVLGPRRLLFGTDSSFFPRGWVSTVFNDQVQALRAMGADADTAAAILGGNLERLIQNI